MGKSKKPKAVRAPSGTTDGTTDDGVGPVDSSPPPDPNLALFASYVRDDRKREQAAKREAREERKRAEAAVQLVQAKDDAAAEVKRLRNRTSATAEERAAADAAYRNALAAVVAEETGERPDWAPVAAAEVAATEAPDADGSPDGDETPPAGSEEDLDSEDPAVGSPDADRQDGEG